MDNSWNGSLEISSSIDSSLDSIELSRVDPVDVERIDRLKGDSPTDLHKATERDEVLIDSYLDDLKKHIEISFKAYMADTVSTILFWRCQRTHSSLAAYFVEVVLPNVNTVANLQEKLEELRAMLIAQHSDELLSRVNHCIDKIVFLELEP